VRSNRSRTKWEACELQRHFDAPFILASDLALTHQDEDLAQGQVLPTCFVEEAVELIADCGQLQSRQHFGQAIGDGMHQKPPPSSASYSPSDRSGADGKPASGDARSPGGERSNEVNRRD
jgi:hypothetical protein